MRKGLSFTLTIVVIAVVLLISGFTLVSLGQVSFSQFGSLFGSQSEEYNADLLRQQCLSEKTRLCDSGAEGTDWAEQALADGRTCQEWAQEENIFGAGGEESIPACD